VCVDIGDTAGLILALEKLVEQKMQGTLPKTPRAFAERFERLKLTGELAKHLEHLMEFDRGEIKRLRTEDV
jgi:hypothetical protein